ncbi:MAG: AAA family ATPase, partial [Deltaproteobacteria bacterium]|nr:AAA family ATPase [Deltaproteobacteria bacterium]
MSPPLPAPTFPPHLTALKGALTQRGALLRLPAAPAEYLRALLHALLEDGALGPAGRVELFEEGVGLSRLTPKGALARRDAPEEAAAAYLRRAVKELDPAAAEPALLWLDLPAEALAAPDLRAALRAWCRRAAPLRAPRVLLATDAPLSDELQEWAREVEWRAPRADGEGLSYLEGLLRARYAPLASHSEQERRRVSERLMTRVRGLDAGAMAAAVGEAAEERAAGGARDLTAWEEAMMDALQRAKSGRLRRAVGLELQPLDGFSGEQLGGMERYKRYLEYMSSLLHHPEARARARLAPPKGVLLVGLPGCGKSLAAKLTASRLSLPLLRLEVGALMGRYLGESEQQLNRALLAVESAAPCVLWIDELDKALGGLSGAEGGGTGSRLLGRLLTWMQEQQEGVYVFATANRVDKLPPELLRRGRFDELWKVGLPTAPERRAILSQKLRERGAGWAAQEVEEGVQLTEGYTGADVEALVREAQVRAFCAGRDGVTVADVRAARGDFTPMSSQFKGEIQEMSAALERHGFRDVSGAEGLPPEVSVARRVMGVGELMRLMSLPRPLRFQFGETASVGLTLQVDGEGRGWLAVEWVKGEVEKPSGCFEVALRVEG